MSGMYAQHPRLLQQVDRGLLMHVLVGLLLP
jgi:hypothetical protein